MRVRFRALALLCFCAATAALGGCGSSTEFPKTAPTSGTATYKGKPVAGLRVTLNPKSASGIAYAPTGETAKDGKFVIITGPNAGAPPGDYVVTITWPKADSDRKTGLDIEVDLLKGKYGDPAKSEWKVTIKDGDNALGPYKLD